MQKVENWVAQFITAMRSRQSLSSLSHIERKRSLLGATNTTHHPPGPHLSHV